MGSHKLLNPLICSRDDVMQECTAINPVYGYRLGLLACVLYSMPYRHNTWAILQYVRFVRKISSSNQERCIINTVSVGISKSPIMFANIVTYPLLENVQLLSLEKWRKHRFQIFDFMGWSVLSVYVPRRSHTHIFLSDSLKVESTFEGEFNAFRGTHTAHSVAPYDGSRGLLYG